MTRRRTLAADVFATLPDGTYRHQSPAYQSTPWHQQQTGAAADMTPTASTPSISQTDHDNWTRYTVRGIRAEDRAAAVIAALAAIREPRGIPAVSMSGRATARQTSTGWTVTADCYGWTDWSTRPLVHWPHRVTSGAAIPSDMTGPDLTPARPARCPSEYPGGVTLAGRAVQCDDPRGKGHDGDHGNSFAARWWTDDDGPRGWGEPDRDDDGSESLGPVTNPDGSPSDVTRAMLAGTGRDPVEFAARVTLSLGHRYLSEDDGVRCFRCGAYAETSDALSDWPCYGPDTEHPAYLLADGTVETCAAHPYADCDPSR